MINNRMPVTAEKKTFAAICSVISIHLTLLISSCASTSQSDSAKVVIFQTGAGKSANEHQIRQTEAPDDPNSPLKIGIEEAILLAMENNQALIVERMNPQIQSTFEQEELAVFDPLLVLK